MEQTRRAHRPAAAAQALSRPPCSSDGAVGGGTGRARECGACITHSGCCAALLCVPAEVIRVVRMPAWSCVMGSCAPPVSGRPPPHRDDSGRDRFAIPSRGSENRDDVGPARPPYTGGAGAHRHAGDGHDLRWDGPGPGSAAVPRRASSSSPQLTQGVGSSGCEGPTCAVTRPPTEIFLLVRAASSRHSCRAAVGGAGAARRGAQATLDPAVRPPPPRARHPPKTHPAAFHHHRCGRLPARRALMGPAAHGRADRCGHWPGASVFPRAGQEGLSGG